MNESRSFLQLALLLNLGLSPILRTHVEELCCRTWGITAANIIGRLADLQDNLELPVRGASRILLRQRIVGILPLMSPIYNASRSIAEIVISREYTVKRLVLLCFSLLLLSIISLKEVMEVLHESIYVSGPHPDLRFLILRQT